MEELNGLNSLIIKDKMYFQGKKKNRSAEESYFYNNLNNGVNNVKLENLKEIIKHLQKDL